VTILEHRFSCSFIVDENSAEENENISSLHLIAMSYHRLCGVIFQS
jgi:hypothetical protein